MALQRSVLHRAEAVSERRFLLRHHLPRDRHSRADVHGAVRHRPAAGLDRPLDGNARVADQEDLPPAADLHRARTSATSCRWKSGGNVPARTLAAAPAVPNRRPRTGRPGLCAVSSVQACLDRHYRLRRHRAALRLGAASFRADTKNETSPARADAARRSLLALTRSPRRACPPDIRPPQLARSARQEVLCMRWLKRWHWSFACWPCAAQWRGRRAATARAAASHRARAQRPAQPSRRDHRRGDHRRAAARWPPPATTTWCASGAPRPAASCTRSRATPTGCARWPSAPTASTLASAGDDRQIILWQVADGKKLLVLPAPRTPVYSLAYSPDGQLLAAVGFEHEVRLYDPRTGQAGAASSTGPAPTCAPSSSRPTASTWPRPVATARSTSGTLPLGDTAGNRGRRSAAFARWPICPTARSWSRPARAARSRCGTPPAARRCTRFTCRSGKVLSMAVCGESLIATGGSDNVVRVWNWQTQSEIDRFVGHTGSVAALAFDPPEQRRSSRAASTRRFACGSWTRPTPQRTPPPGRRFEFRVR